MVTSKNFGTFGGVFTPNFLTILGVILFLRMGWVTGAAGLRDALLILCIANGITLLTSLSLSAISTNTQVGAGGAYFLVSRSLGMEIGGSIRVPLIFAQAILIVPQPDVNSEIRAVPAPISISAKSKGDQLCRMGLMPAE